MSGIESQGRPRPVGPLAKIAISVVAAVVLVGASKPPAGTKPGEKKDPNAIEVRADAALLIDMASGSVLFEKNPDKPFRIGNLTKLMTIAIAGREIKEGRLAPDGEFPISVYAWKTGGAPSHTTTMFAPVNSKARVSDLLTGMAVQMANDGAIAIAEGIGGTEGSFTDLMNKQAKDMGLTASVFANASGLPDPRNVSSARDLSKIARTIVLDYPDVYKLFSQREFTYNKIRQLNRNPLINDGVGGDGLAVDGSKETGYSIVGSAVQNGLRLVVVIGAAPVEKERNEDARKLLDWGFRSFEAMKLYQAGEVIGEAMVFGGAKSGVKVVSETDVGLFLPRGSHDKLKARVVYTGPIKAPVAKGQAIGRLVITRGESVIQEAPVVSAEDISVGGYRARAIDGTRELLLGLFRR